MSRNGAIATLASIGALAVAGAFVRRRRGSLGFVDDMERAFDQGRRRTTWLFFEVDDDSKLTGRIHRDHPPEGVSFVADRVRPEIARAMTSGDTGAVLQAMIAVYHRDWFGRPSDSMLQRSVMRGQDDPGQWSPTAPVVVHRENGWPDDYTDFWQQVDAELERRGVPLYHEPINAAVIAFYPTGA